MSYKSLLEEMQFIDYDKQINEMFSIMFSIEDASILFRTIRFFIDKGLISYTDGSLLIIGTLFGAIFGSSVFLFGSWIKKNITDPIKFILNMKTEKNIQPKDIQKLSKEVRSSFNRIEEPEVRIAIQNMVIKYSRELEKNPDDRQLLIKMQQELLDIKQEFTKNKIKLQ